jgi:hypothetical protein
VRPPREQTPSRSAEAAIRLAAQIYALDQDIASASPPHNAEAMRLRRTGMLESLCVVLEVHHNTQMVYPPMAEQVVAREGARRFRSKLADPDLTHWRLQDWARARNNGPEQIAQGYPGYAPGDDAEAVDSIDVARLAETLDFAKTGEQAGSLRKHLLKRRLREQAEEAKAVTPREQQRAPRAHSQEQSTAHEQQQGHHGMGHG